MSKPKQLAPLFRIQALAAAAMLHEPLGAREITALVITLGGVMVAVCS